MFDNFTYDDTAQGKGMTFHTEYFGDLYVRFNTQGESITRHHDMPFNSDGIYRMKNQIKAISEARPELYIAAQYDAEFTINRVDYTCLHFEVRMWHDKSQLSIYTKGKRVGGMWNDGMTDGARKHLSNEINKLFFTRFDEIAEFAREAEIKRYKRECMRRFKDAQEKIKRTTQ